MARLTLTFLGSFQTSVDGAPLRVHSARIQALLAYLALEPARAHMREALAALFWPDEPDQVAKQNLRQALYQLRQLLGEPAELFLLITRDTVQFNASSDHALDVATLLQHLKQGRLKEAVELYQAELLAQLTSDSDSFEEWLILRREQLHILALDALDRLTERALEQADNAQAQRYARRQLALEPWREHAHRQLMRALARSGDRSAALAQYEACRRILAAELGVEPEQETSALVEQIRSGELDKLTRPALSGVEGWQGDKVTGLSNEYVTPSPRHPVTLPTRHDWADAPDVGVFYGRERELGQLEEWLASDRCRLIAMLGMGGMGKTTLVARLVHRCAEQFAFVIWRSLLNAPALSDLLDSWLRVLSDQQLAQMPVGLDAQLGLLFDYLRRSRCLLVLDNAESMMQGGERAGYYRPGYEDYGQLLLRMGQSSHQSCLLITSREQPRELARLATETQLVRRLPLAGLDSSVGGELLTARGLIGPGASTAALVERYSGNPLALKLVAEAIQDFFAGDIDAFMGDQVLIFDDIRDLLDQQFARLAPLERDILLWLAIERGHSKWLQALVFAPNGQLLVAGSDGQNMRVWDGRTGRVLHRLRGHTSLTEKIAFRADGAQLASASWDQTVRIWDLQSGQTRHTLQGHIGAVATAVIGSGPHARRLIASGGLDHAVRIWDAETGQSIATWHGHRDRVVAFAFSRDGALLASGSWDHTIGVWDTQRNELVYFLHGHAETIESVAFHPSGELLASGSWDRSVRVWDLRTGRLIHTLQRHTDGLEMVTFSPDGALLTSCACDHLVCVWDVQSGRLLYTLQGHTSWVRCIAFGQDSGLLASGSDDGTVKLWDVTPAGAGACKQTIAMEDPYSGMNITGATGITAAQKLALKALGALEETELV